jgi:hypothetical protein
MSRGLQAYSTALGLHRICGGSMANLIFVLTINIHWRRFLMPAIKVLGIGTLIRGATFLLSNARFSSAKYS